MLFHDCDLLYVYHLYMQVRVLGLILAYYSFTTFGLVLRLILRNLVCRHILDVKDDVKFMFVFGAKAMLGRIPSHDTNFRNVLDA